jgi:transposase-like protein
VRGVHGPAEDRDRSRWRARHPSIKHVWRDHEIAETLYFRWRDRLLGGGRVALAGKEERTGERELKHRVVT